MQFKSHNCASSMLRTIHNKSSFDDLLLIRCALARRTNRAQIINRFTSYICSAATTTTTTTTSSVEHIHFRIHHQEGGHKLTSPPVVVLTRARRILSRSGPLDITLTGKVRLSEVYCHVVHIAHVHTHIPQHTKHTQMCRLLKRLLRSAIARIAENAPAPTQAIVCDLL